MTIRLKKGWNTLKQQNFALSGFRCFGMAKWLLVLFASIMVFGQAHAVSLGKATVKSKMGQPFEAIVPIYARSDEAGGLKVRLAPGQEYEKLEVKYEYFLSKVFAEMVVDKNLKPTHVRIFSRVPLFQPKITLVLDAVWPEGRFMRTYVFLVQPSENPYTIANAANQDMAGGMAGGVPVINLDEPVANDTPLINPYWQQPTPTKRPVKRTSKKSTSKPATFTAEQQAALDEKRQELDDLKAQIQDLKEKINP